MNAPHGQIQDKPDIGEYDITGKPNGLRGGVEFEHSMDLGSRGIASGRHDQKAEAGRVGWRSGMWYYGAHGVPLNGRVLSMPSIHALGCLSILNWDKQKGLVMWGFD